MSGLAAGLARGLAMYGQGRMIAEEREAERQRQEAERQRQMAMMKLQQDQFALQREQFEAGQRQTALANKRVAESDTNEAIGKGFRFVGDQWDTFNDLVGIDPSKAETITVNGQTMRKVAPTQAFQQGIIQRREQENELQRKVAEEKQRREQILGTIKDGPMRALAAQLPLDELQKLTSGRLKDMMTPKAGPAPLTQKDDNGNLWFSTDGGRSWNPSRINTGASAAATDAPRAQPMPVNPNAALSQSPGSGFSSQFQLPATGPARQAAQPPAGAMPTFGNKNKPRPLPNAVVEDIRQNNKTLSVIQQAIQGLEQNPDAVGLHNYLPDVVLNRWNVKGFRDGVDVRANVGDIGSMTVKDRSGASVTVSEAPRLKPFVPSANDDPQTALKKLRRMAQIIEQDNMEIQSFYGDMASMYSRGSEPDMNDPGFQAFLAAQLQGRRP